MEQQEGGGGWLDPYSLRFKLEIGNNTLVYQTHFIYLYCKKNLQLHCPKSSLMLTSLILSNCLVYWFTFETWRSQHCNQSLFTFNSHSNMEFVSTYFYFIFHHISYMFHFITNTQFFRIHNMNRINRINSSEQRYVL